MFPRIYKAWLKEERLPIPSCVPTSIISPVATGMSGPTRCLQQFGAHCPYRPEDASLPISVRPLYLPSSEREYVKLDL